ncbi:MAG: hypothetical protein MZV63_13490 [Marinilabiliales bacterium]|nr:hypothetical protein [Marinilabiliales bacterium]
MRTAAISGWPATRREKQRREGRPLAKGPGQALVPDEHPGKVPPVAGGRHVERRPIGERGVDIRAFVDGLERRLAVARNDGPGQGADRSAASRRTVRRSVAPG